VDPYYEDDQVTLYHGDNREVLDWLAADVLVTDPPYGMGYETHAPKNYARRARSGSLTITVVGDKTTELRDAMLAQWGEGRPALVFGTWRVHKPLMVQTTIVWDKGDSPGMGQLDLPWGSSHEEVYVLGPVGVDGGWQRTARGRMASVIRVNGLASQHPDRLGHPTPKPVGLLERLLQECPPGVIADPFAGSGSTLVAAKGLGRRAIGVELEERYCEVIAKRLAQDTLFGGAA
jgi:DNA modification methylase